MPFLGDVQKNGDVPIYPNLTLDLMLEQIGQCAKHEENLELIDYYDRESTPRVQKVLKCTCIGIVWFRVKDRRWNIGIWYAGPCWW